MEVSFMAYPKNICKVIYSVRLGLTALSSLILRHEETLIITKVKSKGGDLIYFNNNAICPFKGELEKYYQENYCLITDFKILIGAVLMLFL